MNKCKNCREFLNVNSRYCTKCGQAVIDQVNGSFVKGILMEAFSFDRGLSYNVKCLLQEGGRSAARYISGETKPFQNPILFFLTSLGLLFFVMSITEPLMNGDFVRYLENGEQSVVRIQTIGPDTRQVRWLYLIIITLILPFLSLILYFLRDQREGTFLHALLTGIFLLSALTIMQSLLMLINRMVFHFINPLTGYYQPDEVGLFISVPLLLSYAGYYLYTLYTKNRWTRTLTFTLFAAMAVVAAIYLNHTTQTITAS